MKRMHSANSASILNILHLLSQRPDATGSGIYIQAMIREASARKHTNFLVAGIQADEPVQLSGIEDNRCRFVRFESAEIPFPIPGMSDIMPYASSRFRDLSQTDIEQYETSFTRHLVAAVDRFQPDIIHSHHLWIVTALARRLFDHLPIVTTCHGTDLRQFQNCPHLQPRVQSACRRLDAVMALSPAQRQEIVDRFGLPLQKVHVVGAGYDDGLFVKRPKPHPDPVQIVYAGKLCRAKGVPWMLRALATIDALDWHLNLVGGGSGEEKRQCLQLAAHLGDRVTVHGSVTQRHLAGIMAQSHLFVLSSFFEGLPLVMLEALASGCRIIATDLPGVKAVLDGVEADFISLVQTPRLIGVDQPMQADEGRYEKDLADAFRYQIGKARQAPNIDLTGIEEMMGAHTWHGIFEKVQDVYYAATARKPKDRSLER